MSIDEFRPKASSLCSAESYRFKCNTTINRGIKRVITYTAGELLMLQPTDVTMP